MALNTSAGTRSQRTMGRRGIILSSIQRLLSILTACIFIWRDINDYSFEAGTNTVQCCSTFIKHPEVWVTFDSRLEPISFPFVKAPENFERKSV